MPGVFAIAAYSSGTCAHACTICSYASSVISIKEEEEEEAEEEEGEGGGGEQQEEDEVTECLILKRPALDGTLNS